MRIRTFVALNVTESVRSRAAELADRLRESQADVKWMDSSNMHLTLKFLGDVSEQELAEVCHTAQAVCRETDVFELQCGGAGAFPNADRPRTVWIGVSQGSQPLAALHQRMEQAFRELGFRREQRRFHGHLTLGRVQGGGPKQQALGELLGQYDDFQTPIMLAEEVRVYASYLDKTGPTYEILARCPLAANRADPGR